jgi:hypothetical protein
MKPYYIVSYAHVRGYTPLEREWRDGRFERLSARSCSGNKALWNISTAKAGFRSNHASNYLALAGTLNRDKEKMIAKLERALDGDERFRPEYFRGL